MRTIDRNVSTLAAAVLALASLASAQASWQVAYPPQTPPPLGQWRMVFDEPRGAALVLFPGSGQVGNSFWRWNGTTWDQPNATPPPQRFDCYVAFDVARQRVVLYGGTSFSGYLQEIWEWDGTLWQLRPAAGFPPGRTFGGFAYDRARSVCVLFGGSGAAGALGDTWEWNGTTWSQASAAVHPSARHSHVMAFDPSTQRILLYGGTQPGGTSSLTDTWTWNGSLWQQRFPATPPFARQGPVMVSDLARSRVLLYGGHIADFQTWEWDGAQWHASVPATPGPLNEHSATYDTQRGEVLMLAPFTSTLWRYGTSSPATTVSFGAGCPGTAGLPVLTNAPYQLPWLGDTVRNRVTTVPGSLGALFVSSFTPATPTSLAQIGMPGCDLLVTPDALDFRTANAGSAEWALVIPNQASLVGVPIHQQALPLDPTANALGLVASNGLVMQAGIR